MAQGKVTVDNGNQMQGSTNDIEKKALFVGVGATNPNTTQSLNVQSDLDIIFGEADCSIKTIVTAAKANGGSGWEASARIIDVADDWRDEVDIAMDTVSPELIVVCTPAVNSAALDDAHAKAEDLRTSLARRVFILIATAGIDPASQTWDEYETAQIGIVDGVAANRVAPVPLLHGNDLGVLAGRLCRSDVSIADTPMRVETGAVIGLGAVPVDSDGVELTDVTLATLDSNRLSCVQHYVDLDGTFWGDCNLLEIEGGDYQVVEYLRPVDAIAREIRLIEIGMIGSRSINPSPTSQALTINKLMAPLRRRSKTTVFAGRQLPGEIEPPTGDSITLVWESLTKLKTYFVTRPVGAPKSIESMIYLDLSDPES